MRIHANNISDSPIGVTHPTVIRDAANYAGVQIERLTVHGSRSRARAFDVILSGSGVTGGQWGNSGTNGAAPVKAATWDEWGIFLARLFDADDSVYIPRVYESAEHFHWATGGRFRHLTPQNQDLRHNWSEYDRSATGAYMVNTCSKCGAVRRYMLHGHSLSEVFTNV